MQRRPPSSPHQTTTRSWHATKWTRPRCYRRLLAMLIDRPIVRAFSAEKMCEALNLQQSQVLCNKAECQSNRSSPTSGRQRMETAEAMQNPWITVSKRKRSRLSGASQDGASKAEQTVEKLPTNGFLNLSLADDERNGQAIDGAANEEATRPSSSEAAVPPRKKKKKESKKVSPPTTLQTLTVEIVSLSQAKGQRCKPTCVSYSSPSLIACLIVGLPGLGFVDVRRQQCP